MVEIKFSKVVKDFVPIIPIAGTPVWNIRALKGAVIRPYSVSKMRTGVITEVPKGYELVIRGKPEGLTVIGGLGITYGNIGEIIIPVKNNYAFSKKIQAGDVIAEMVLRKIEDIEWKEITETEEVKEPEVKEPEIIVEKTEEKDAVSSGKQDN